VKKLGTSDKRKKTPIACNILKHLDIRTQLLFDCGIKGVIVVGYTYH
jgi:hypothetical protein